ncbi:MAG: mechanosensitive ion channel [Gammaproteobacteria bacterium]|jgi:small-conductance mechanosensitive channel
MQEIIDFEKLQATLVSFFEKSVVHISDPLFWLQFALIAIAFVLANWLFAPLLRKGLIRLQKSFTRIPRFKKPLAALSELMTPVSWLILQRITIELADKYDWPKGALTILTSLLTAWLLIRLVSMLVTNDTLARFIAYSAWSVAALNIFGLLTPVVEVLDSWFINIGEARVSPLTVLKVGLALWLSLWLASGLAALAERNLIKAESVSPAMRVLGAKLVKISLFTIAFLIAVSAVGIDLTAFAVFSGALGVGLGFGLQKIFSNLVSGVILLMDRSIKPGDVIAVGDSFGWINHLGARYASVITRNGVEHLIPNEELITQRVENWSYSDDLVRLKIPIGISYNSDVRKAMELCVEAAKTVSRVHHEPEPRCQLIGFGDSSVNLELRIWINDPSNGRANVISEVLLGVWDRFHEHDIQIPFPQQDLHVKSLLGEDDLVSIKKKLTSEAIIDHD